MHKLFLKPAELIPDIDEDLWYFATIVAIMFILFNVFVGGILWLGGLQHTESLTASILISFFWFTGNAAPFWASGMLAGLLKVGGIVVFKLFLWLEDIGNWVDETSFPLLLLSFATIYFFIIWPMASLRQAIWPR